MPALFAYLLGVATPMFIAVVAWLSISIRDLRASRHESSGDTDKWETR